MEIKPQVTLDAQSNSLFVLQASKGPIEWESNSWSDVTWGFFFLAYTPSNQELLCRDVANKAIITMMMMSKVQGSFSFLFFFWLVIISNGWLHGIKPQ